jgi:phospho-N-acetylmuramoyl-pentapeptide-transferase
MLYELLYPLREVFFGFNVVRYITFRAAAALGTSFIICIVFGRPIINQLTRLKIWQNIRTKPIDGLFPLHKQKEGTPSMGGLIILLGVLVSTLLWADLKNSYIIVILGATIWFGFIGFMDDYLKLVKDKSSGLTITAKLIGQVLIGLVIGLYIYYNPQISQHLDIPFLKDLTVNLGMFYILFVMLVIVGSSNAVNLTDGLDGLAIGCVIMVALALAGLSYLSGHVKFSEYLHIMNIAGAGELSIFCASIIGSGLGFLWYNSYPAEVFMGDTGSLALGGALGIVAVFIKKELILLLIGGIFVFEALTVILQVASFKLRGKRIFLVAPFHHHLQMKGWPEPKIIIRLWLVAAILALLSLVTLKLR